MQNSFKTLSIYLETVDLVNKINIMNSLACANIPQKNLTLLFMPNNSFVALTKYKAAHIISSLAIYNYREKFLNKVK